MQGKNFTALALDNGDDIKMVQTTLRHADPSTTQRYVHCTDKMMRAGANTMDSMYKRVKVA